MYKNVYLFSCTLVCIVGLAACHPSEHSEQQTLDHSGLPPLNINVPADSEYLPGGDATSFVANYEAFSRRPQKIAQNFQLDGMFTSGDHLFRTPVKGIGPLLNTGSCQGCHLNDGRGVVPDSITEPFTSILVKIGDQSGVSDPNYGDQIQTFAVDPTKPNQVQFQLAEKGAGLNGKLVGEAYAAVTYQQINGQYPDGTPYQLRQPVYVYNVLSYGPFMQGIQFSPRVAPQVFGVGLLEAIPSQHIQALADPDDTDNNGVSGRVSWVKDALSGETALGRFAYKAQTPSVLQQVAAAFNGDSGVTSSIFQNENCTPTQVKCIETAAKNPKQKTGVDVSDQTLALIEFYNRTLAVPANRGFDAKSKTWAPEFIEGRDLFNQAGCADCHTPRHVTGVAKGSKLGEAGLNGLTANSKPIEVLSQQVIYPYTDLLLHDMGGECQIQADNLSLIYKQSCTGLADGLPQGNAGPNEWKTAPLWGLGLVQKVNPKATFLHDGRARTIEEAILWHGGEGLASLDKYKHMDKSQRQSLLAFVASL